MYNVKYKSTRSTQTSTKDAHYPHITKIPDLESQHYDQIQIIPPN